jgi:hypothetical protein
MDLIVLVTGREASNNKGRNGMFMVDLKVHPTHCRFVQKAPLE